jgi:hypothetical protein
VPKELSARAGGARADLLAALDVQRLTGYRASRELAWVVFPAGPDGATSLEVLHVPHLGTYRVVARELRTGSLEPAAVLGEFDIAGDAAACVAEALAGTRC